MRRYLLNVTLLMTMLLSPACGEHGIEIPFPSETVSVIPTEGEPSFAQPDWLRTPDVVNVRVHGVALAPIAGHPPEDREALESLARSAVRSHERQMTQALIDHVERTLEREERADLKWQTTRVLGSDVEMKIESSALRVRYEYELHLRASPELFALLAPNQRVDPSFVLNVGDSWWGDSESAVSLKLAEAPAPDAFLPYPEMAQDGAIDIAVHVGDGSSVTTPANVRIEETGLSLLSQGWKHPWAPNFRAMEAIELPFTREASFNGEVSELRVMLIKENAATRTLSRRLSNSLMMSLTQRDIVILRDLEPTVEVAVAEAIGFGSKELPATLGTENRAQLVIMHRTSESSWVDHGMTKVRANSKRDVIEFGPTTTSDDTILDALVAGLTLADASGRHIPLSIGSLHRIASQHTEDPLHLCAWGLQDNPGLNPYGTQEALCADCAGPGQCGAAGNLCVLQGDAGACGLACTSDLSCPNGYRCGDVVADTGLDFLPRQCVPRSGACGM